MQKQMTAQMGAMLRQQTGASSDVAQKVMDFVSEKMSWDATAGK